jgi:hypothetical protein
LDKVGCLGRLVKLLLEFLSVSEAVKLKRAGILLLGIELFSKELREHLINAEVRQEEIVVGKELALILVLLEVLLQLGDAYDFGYAWDLQRGKLILQGPSRVFRENADSGAVLLSFSLEGVRNLDLKRSRGRTSGDLSESKNNLEELLLILQEILCFGGTLLLLLQAICLKGLNCFYKLLPL